jgi:hypothetical protein
MLISIIIDYRLDRCGSVPSRYGIFLPTTMFTIAIDACQQVTGYFLPGSKVPKSSLS